jgi:hypothetical protein
MNLIFASELFHFSKTTGRYVVEASEMTDFTKEDPQDTKISLTSQLTGACVTFELSQVEKTEGRVDNWIYHPTKQSELKYPGCVNLAILVINQ